VNILLRKYSNSYRFVKITEFGLMAIHELSDPTHSVDNGKAKYTAPEVIYSKNYDTKGDIHSVGVILRNMFDLEPDGY
jgi:serine/threonine protein kinase